MLSMTSGMFGIECFRPFRADVLTFEDNRASPCLISVAPLGLVQNNLLIDQSYHL